MTPAEFDPHRDTDASVAEPSGPDPFDDWPKRSLADPMGEVAGFGRLARATTNARGGARRRVGVALGVLLAVSLGVPIASQLWNLLTS